MEFQYMDFLLKFEGLAGIHKDYIKQIKQI